MLIRRMVMSLLETGRHPKAVFTMSLWTRNPTPCSCLSSYPLKKTFLSECAQLKSNNLGLGTYGQSAQTPCLPRPVSLRPLSGGLALQCSTCVSDTAFDSGVYVVYFSQSLLFRCGQFRCGLHFARPAVLSCAVFLFVHSLRVSVSVSLIFRIVLLLFSVIFLYFL